ncbi:hypothetical protein C8J56DRAFT_1053730 [Mycena floridula]|nr:hypothetical protein C8J56DRAFT_1053730 [Mycena floridula]
MVVGCDDGDALVKDMVRIFGVVGARTEDVLREKESLVSCWMEWKLAAGRCLTLSIACHDTFMPIIISAGTTSQMDFITSNHLVSPYPRLSMNGLSMQPVTNGWFSSRSDIVERQRYTKLDVLNNNSSSEGPCEYNCPGLVRDVNRAPFSGAVDANGLFETDLIKIYN